jgi:isocitrate lyase
MEPQLVGWLLPGTSSPEPDPDSSRHRMKTTTTPTGRICRATNQIDKYARKKGLTLIPKRANQQANVKNIHSRLGGRHNFLKLGLEEWPST